MPRPPRATRGQPPRSRPALAPLILALLAGCCGTPEQKGPTPAARERELKALAADLDKRAKLIEAQQRDHAEAKKRLGEAEGRLAVITADRDRLAGALNSSQQTLEAAQRDLAKAQRSSQDELERLAAALAKANDRAARLDARGNEAFVEIGTLIKRATEPELKKTLEEIRKLLAREG